MLLLEVIASCVSDVFVYVLLRLLMSLQRLERLVSYVMVLRKCLHLICCSSWISSDIFLFSVFIRLMISNVENWFLSDSFCGFLFLMYLWNPELQFFTAPVEICCLLLCMSIRVKSVKSSLSISRN